jgi:hypothetical protein
LILDASFSTKKLAGVGGRRFEWPALQHLAHVVLTLSQAAQRILSRMRGRPQGLSAYVFEKQCLRGLFLHYALLLLIAPGPAAGQ